MSVIIRMTVIAIVMAIIAVVVSVVRIADADMNARGVNVDALRQRS
jgi:hypothetical protein